MARPASSFLLPLLFIPPPPSSTFLFQLHLLHHFHSSFKLQQDTDLQAPLENESCSIGLPSFCSIRTTDSTHTYFYQVLSTSYFPTYLLAPTSRVKWILTRLAITGFPSSAQLRPLWFRRTIIIRCPPFPVVITISIFIPPPPIPWWPSRFTITTNTCLSC